MLLQGSNLFFNRDDSSWEQQEWEADDSAIRWGFDMMAFRKWGTANDELIKELTNNPSKGPLSWILPPREQCGMG